MCPDRAFARQMIASYKLFKRAKRNGADPAKTLQDYWEGKPVKTTPEDVLIESAYGNLSRVFPWLRSRTLHEHLLFEFRERVMDTENDEGLAD